VQNSKTEKVSARRSTVLSLPLQLVVPVCDLYNNKAPTILVELTCLSFVKGHLYREGKEKFYRTQKEILQLENF
jgi:hypothetical protein